MTLAALIPALVPHLETFLLVMVRLGAMLAAAPVLGHRTIPAMHRGALAALLALVLTPVVGQPAGRVDDVIAFGLQLASEALLGAAIGFVAHLVVAAVQAAGELVGFQMGFGIATLYDPQFGEPVNVIGRLQETMAVLVFLALDGHHMLIRAVAVSFRQIRPGALVAPAVIGAGMAPLGGRVLSAAIQLAAPLLGILLVLNIGMALLARVAPQTNAFFLASPVTVGIGLLGLIQTAPHFARAIGTLVTGVAGDLDVVLRGGLVGAR
jgi:flagellar biosynthetic protein FliR